MPWNLGRRLRPLELQTDVDEVVRRPRACVLERELLVLGGNPLDAVIECAFLVPRYEERPVENHLVADGLVDAGGYRDVSQLLEDFRHVVFRSFLEAGFDEASVLHSREVGGTLLRRDLAPEPANVFILLLEL